MRIVKFNFFAKLFFSFVIVFIVPVFIGVFLYDNIEKNMVKQAYDSNTAMTKQIQLTVDGRLKEVDYLWMQISIYPKLNALLELERGDRYEFIQLSKELARLQTGNEFIENAYLYFKNSDVLLSGSIKTNSRNFYNYIYTHSNYTLTEFTDTYLTSNYFREYIPSQPVVQDGKVKNVITYAQSFPLSERTEITGFFGIMIDEEKIMHMLDTEYSALQGDLFIFNKDGEMILGSSQVWNEYKPEIKNNKIIQTKVESDGYGWTYVSLVEKKLVLKDVNATKKAATIVLILWIIVGTAVCVWFAKKHYRPIEQLVQEVDVQLKMNAGNTVDEFQAIKDRIQHLFAQEKQLVKQIDEYVPVIQTDFLIRLIGGRVDLLGFAQNEMQNLGLKFNGEYFCVVLIDIDNCTEFMKTQLEREWIFIRFILMNITQELIGDKGYVFELDRDRVAVLISYEEHNADQHQQMKQLLDQVKLMMKDRFKTEVYISLSNVHRGIQHVDECYGEAVVAMHYKLVEPNTNILSYAKVQEKTIRTYQYPMETEQQMMNYLKSGDQVNVDRLLNQVFSINFSHPNDLTPEMSKGLFFDLLSTYIKVGSLYFTEEELWNRDQDPAQFIWHSSSVDELQTMTKQLYTDITKRISEHRVSTSSHLFEQIKTYILENFTDNQLSLNEIANTFQMNASYLSSFFKKQSGMNLSDYMTQLRIERCKQLLKETDLTIAEIAVLVGYANNISLTRVFKKSEGITPGKYRENLMSKQN